MYGMGSDFVTQLPYCQGTKSPGELSCPISVQSQPNIRVCYKSYVSSLSGRIDPKFSQKNFVDEYGGFAVPFHYGESKMPTRFSGMLDNSDNDCIGMIWECEVDEEARLIELKDKNPPK